MKISILCSNISSNCLGRAYVLAKLLQKRFEVEIVGCAFRDGIWPPLANSENIKYKYVKIGRIPKSYWQLIKLFRQKIDGDVIYTCKPMLVSFGAGLFRKWREKKPLVLDIDDWERGFVKEKFSNRNFARNFVSLVSSAIYFYKQYSRWSLFACEKSVRFADEITISNNFLKQKFGGTTICHARDTNVFDPALFDKTSIRKKYNAAENRKVVMFFGTPTVHKGTEDLIKAIGLIDEQDVTLVIVGINETRKYWRTLIDLAKQTLGSERFIGFGFQPFEKVPEILSMADVVVIPQRRNFASVGQLPAKLFDAMAMAKPIIATNVSELPEILKDCGWIVEPEKPKELAETIKYVLNNYSQAEEKGRKARQKCIEKYSCRAMEKILCDLFAKYEKPLSWVPKRNKGRLGSPL